MIITKIPRTKKQDPNKIQIKILKSFAAVTNKDKWKLRDNLSNLELSFLYLVLVFCFLVLL